MNKKTISLIIVIIILIIGLFFFFGQRNQQTAASDQPLQAFAQCLKESGTIFYGAFWCPHCQNQKALFKSAAKDLPYVECSTPNGQGRLAVCEEANIEGYPTWVFPDQSRLSGEQTLATLAEKSGCEAPQ